jgi:hypothetical protein
MSDGNKGTKRAGRKAYSVPEAHATPLVVAPEFTGPRLPSDSDAAIFARSVDWLRHYGLTALANELELRTRKR